VKITKLLIFFIEPTLKYGIGKTHAIRYFSPLFVGFLGIINTLKGRFYVEQGP
jgi:hypothetical protein